MRPEIYLDSVHNPGGIKASIQTARKVSDGQRGKPWLLFIATSDKDYEHMAKQLYERMVWETVGVIHMNSNRGLMTEELARVFKTHTSRPVCSHRDAESTVENMVEKSQKGLLFCAGSLCLTSKIKAVLERKSWADPVR